MSIDFIVKNQALHQQIYTLLKQEILHHQLQPGERIVDAQVAARLGVSRTPAREAIRKLELEGLVTMIPRRGAEVAEITEKNMRDVLEVRRALEELAVKIACEKMTDEEIIEFWKNECGIMPSGGLEFGEAGSQYVRLNLACPKKILLRVLENMKKGFDGLKS